MFTATSRTTHFASFTFSLLIAIAINGSLLMKFDSVATNAYLARSAQSDNVAVLETVTIVGHRI